MYIYIYACKVIYMLAKSRSTVSHGPLYTHSLYHPHTLPHAHTLSHTHTRAHRVKDWTKGQVVKFVQEGWSTEEDRAKGRAYAALMLAQDIDGEGIFSPTTMSLLSTRNLLVLNAQSSCWPRPCITVCVFRDCARSPYGWVLLFKPLLKPLFKAWSPERCGFVAVLMLLCLCARPLRSLAALSLGQRKSWAQHSRATQQGNSAGQHASTSLCLDG